MTTKVVKLFKGVNWLLFVTWYTQIAGMLSFFILARYLSKDDFGVIAGCFVVQGFFAVIANVGTNHYLIRKKEVTKEDLDIAFTINFSTRTLIAIAIFLLANPLASFMKIPDLEMVLKVMSLSPFFIGLHNPAVSLKLKDLDYSAISYLRTITKTISTTLTVVITIYYQTYWAVVVGEIAYQAIYAIGSYRVAAYKPKFRVVDIQNQWTFSKWILLKGVASYSKNVCDNVIVSRNFVLSDLGMYKFSKEASNTVVNFLIMPITSIFYTGLSSYVEDNQQLVDKIYKFLMVISLLYMPVVFGGVYLSETLVPFVFGEKWADTSSLFALFLVMTFARNFNQVFSDVFVLIDQVKKQFLYELISSVIVIAIVVMVSSLPLFEFAICRVILAYLVLLSMILYLSKMIPIRVGRVMKIMILPFILSGTMTILIHAVDGYITQWSDASRLLVLIGTGFIFYLGACLFTLNLLKKRVPDYRYLYESVILHTMSVITAKIGAKLSRR